MRALAVPAVLGALACAALPAARAASPSPAGPFPAVYAFGDSLSDAGNDYAALGGAEPVSPPYSYGRFSNGAVWAQDLARAAAGLRLRPSLLGGLDFAYGGAESGQTSVHSLAPNDLPSQLAQFLAAVPAPRPGALYTLWIGANDLFSILDRPSLSPQQVQAAETEIVANEAAFVTAVAARGAHNLLVVNIPDLGKVPAVMELGPAAAAAASALTADFNAKLAAAMRGLAHLYGLRLAIVDSAGLIDRAITHPRQFGFTDVTAPCWTGSYTSATSGTVCSTVRALQDRHLFWDHIHPTARGHAAIAAAAEQALAAAAAAY